MQPGKHVLLHIPRGATADMTLLHVVAEARQMGGQCADIYFQELNITGAWAELQQTGGFRFRAQDVGFEGMRMSFGKLDLKVVHGRTSQGARYINVYIQHLGRVGLAVGGLLGEDDHWAEEIPPQGCGQRATLFRTDNELGERSRKLGPGMALASIAEASLV